MTLWRQLLAMTALAAAPAAAQISPQPRPGDPRLQTVMYDPTQIIQLRGAPGYQLTIELSPDEQVQSVALGDTGAWQVSANKAGDHLFIKPAQASVATNMTVITTVRTYNFDLVPLAGPAMDMAYIVRFQYPADEINGAMPATASNDTTSPRAAAHYRVEGDRALRPSAVTDDGLHTYISWPADSALPATFQLGDDGKERLVNGIMRGNSFVVDGIAKKLVFRIDARTASATRVPPRKAR